MDKFGRNYELTIQVASGDLITVTPPFTVEFDVARHQLRSSNTCQLRIYNLAEKRRNQIRKDILSYSQRERIIFKAGYGSNLPVIFAGDVKQAWSVREGVNFITQVECFGGGYASVNGIVNMVFPAGTQRRDVISQVAGTLPNTTVGTIGSYPGALSRGNSVSGNSIDVLHELTGGGSFIDNDRVHALGTYETVEAVGTTVVVTPASGLLGTPVLEQTVVHFDMLFEPRLLIGQKVLIDGFTEKRFNGEHKVTSVKHRGMISEAVCGQAITTVEFLNLGGAAA